MPNRRFCERGAAIRRAIPLLRQALRAARIRGFGTRGSENTARLVAPKWVRGNIALARQCANRDHLESFNRDGSLQIAVNQDRSSNNPEISPSGGAPVISCRS